MKLYHNGRVAYTWSVDGPQTWEWGCDAPPARPWDKHTFEPREMWTVVDFCDLDQIQIVDPFPYGKKLY